MVLVDVSPSFSTILGSGQWVWCERQGRRTKLDASGARLSFVVHNLDILLYTHAKNDGGCSCTDSLDPPTKPGKPPCRNFSTRQVQITSSAVRGDTKTQPPPPTSRKNIPGCAEEYCIDKTVQHEQPCYTNGDREGNRCTIESREPSGGHRDDDYSENDWVPQHVLRHSGQMALNTLVICHNVRSIACSANPDFGPSMEFDFVSS